MISLIPGQYTADLALSVRLTSPWCPSCMVSNVRFRATVGIIMRDQHINSPFKNDISYCMEQKGRRSWCKLFIEAGHPF